MDQHTARRRSQLLAEIRRFFTERGYLEVETPLLAPALIPESTIEAFRTDFVRSGRPAEPFFLVPSPEIWMKRLQAMGWGDLFQLSKAFRNAESIGRLHNPEFTMLEWYTRNADYLSSLDIAEALLARLAESCDAPPACRPPCRRIRIEDAFRELAGVELAACDERGELVERARSIGVNARDDDSWEEVYNRIFVDRIEPALPTDRPLALMDYPAGVACLARRKAGGPWRERWELYLDGVETANCFSEQQDPAEAAEFFRIETEAKRSALVEIRVDAGFPGLFRAELPPSSGVALGVDRLLMALFNIRNIGGVIFFPFSDILRKNPIK
jgi:elongation factor P--(R)-beta-lysine ligase